MFGEMTLVDGTPRSATARARDACELAPIDRKLFILMIDEAPNFALNVMRVMASRLRRAIAIEMVTSRTVGQLLALDEVMHGAEVVACAPIGR